MRRAYPGELEEIGLLMVSDCDQQACGLSIWEEIQEQTGRTITLLPYTPRCTAWKRKDSSLLSWVGLPPGGANAGNATGRQALKEVEQLQQDIPQGKLQLSAI